MVSDRLSLEHTEDCPADRDDCTCGGYVPMAEVERLRAIITDLIEGETAEEGTPQWYALRNARAALAGALDEEDPNG